MLEIVIVGMVVLLFGLAVGMVRKEYRAGGTLHRPTVAVVWAAYLLHAGVTTWFAWVPPLGRLDVPGGPFIVVGVLLGLSGVVIAGLAIVTFRSFHRMSGLDTSRLIDTGIYRHSRNPQNLGWGLALLGLALAGRSPSALGLVVLFGLVIHGYVVGLEEPYLESLYGDEFREYMSQVPRYVGTPG
jgi:protein-S-isoprenylcysteine O-methyltransferase Ste14